MIRFIVKLTVGFWYVMLVVTLIEILKALCEISMIIALLVTIVVVKTGYQILVMAR